MSEETAAYAPNPNYVPTCGACIVCWYNNICVAEALEFWLSRFRSSMGEQVIQQYSRMIDHHRDMASRHALEAKQHYPQRECEQVLLALTGDPFIEF